MHAPEVLTGRSVGAAEGVRASKRPKNRRAQIAMAAAELFCAHGYHGVGIDEIAAAVGISGPAVYRHFPTKYAILVEATRNLVDATLTATKPPAGAGEPAERLHGALGALAGLAVERRRVGGLYQWEGRYLAPEHRAEFRAGLATLVGRLARPLRRLRPELRPADADALARAALSVFGSVATHRAPVTKGRAEQALCRAAWAVLGAEPMTAPRKRREAGGAWAEERGERPGAGVAWTDERRERSDRSEEGRRRREGPGPARAERAHQTGRAAAVVVRFGDDGVTIHPCPSVRDHAGRRRTGQQQPPGPRVRSSPARAAASDAPREGRS